MKNNRNFRDFLYDKNDIIIALLIIVASILVIVWRVSNVMDYPKTLDSVATAEQVQSAVDEEASNSGESEQPKAKWKSGKLAEDFSVTLSDESQEAAIGSLVSADLFASAEQFEEVCERVGVSAADIKTGDFLFKKGSNKSAIAKQVTR